MSPRLLRFLTHPQVCVDPATPVPQWDLSDVGRARAEALRGAPFLAGTTSIWSSTEVKAIRTAELIAAELFAGGIPHLVREDLGENDRSATGFVPPQEFEALADAFFAHPEESVRGWATAADEQRRIVAAVDAVLTDERSGHGDIAVVAHGGVGTLLLCHLLGRPITRELDQPGQGHYFSIDRDTREVQHRWLPLEELAVE